MTATDRTEPTLNASNPLGSVTVHRASDMQSASSTQRPANNGSANPSENPAQDPLAPILLNASKGDPEAWKQIVDLYSRRVYAMARSRLGGSRRTGGNGGSREAAGNVAGGVGGTGLSSPPHRRDAGLGTGDDAAEEITQSVFVTIASKLASGGYTERGKFEPWLFRIAMNRVRDEARRRKRQATPTDPSDLACLTDHAAHQHTSDHASDSDRTQLLSLLRDAMQQLSESDREIIELRHHASMSFKSMADVLDEPVGTLLARHHRALRKLKDLLPASVRSLYESPDQAQMGQSNSQTKGQPNSQTKGAHA